MRYRTSSQSYNTLRLRVLIPYLNPRIVDDDKDQEFRSGMWLKTLRRMPLSSVGSSIVAIFLRSSFNFDVLWKVSPSALSAIPRTLATCSASSALVSLFANLNPRYTQAVKAVTSKPMIIVASNALLLIGD